MKTTNGQLIRYMQQQCYEEIKAEFIDLGKDGHYTDLQKRYAIKQIQEYGVRATASILSMPRRTLQRWCRQYDINVKRCPEWVFEWAEKRKKRREFWQRRGYY